MTVVDIKINPRRAALADKEDSGTTNEARLQGWIREQHAGPLYFAEIPHCRQALLDMRWNFYINRNISSATLNGVTVSNPVYRPD
jgi:hypothetical protein